MSDYLVMGCNQYPFLMDNAHSWCVKQLETFFDPPVAFAVACLVAMAELYEKPKVWTLDGDFRIYRKRDRRMIPILAPDRF